MRPPNRVRIALQYLGMCNCVEQGWDRHRDLTDKEVLVKQNALDYLNRYFLGDFLDENEESIGLEQGERKTKKVRRSNGKKGI